MVSNWTLGSVLLGNYKNLAHKLVQGWRHFFYCHFLLEVCTFSSASFCCVQLVGSDSVGASWNCWDLALPSNLLYLQNPRIPGIKLLQASSHKLTFPAINLSVDVATCGCKVLWFLNLVFLLAEFWNCCDLYGWERHWTFLPPYFAGVPLDKDHLSLAESSSSEIPLGLLLFPVFCLLPTSENVFQETWSKMLVLVVCKFLCRSWLWKLRKKCFLTSLKLFNKAINLSLLLKDPYLGSSCLTINRSRAQKPPVTAATA